MFCSPSTGIQDEEEMNELGKQDLYQLNQWIQANKIISFLNFLPGAIR